MSLIWAWRDLGEQTGEAVGTFAGQAAQGIGEAICNIRSQFPNQVGSNPFARNFLRELCNTVTPPPAGGGDLNLAEGAYKITIDLEYFPRFATAPVSRTEILWTETAPFEGDIVNIQYRIESGGQIVRTKPIRSIDSTDPIDWNSNTKIVNLASGSVVVEESIQYTVEFVGTPPDNEEIPDNLTNVTVNFDRTEFQVTNNIGGDVYDLVIPVTNNQVEFPVTVNFGGDNIYVGYEGIENPPPVATDTNGNPTGGGGSGTGNTTSGDGNDGSGTTTFNENDYDTVLRDLDGDGFANANEGEETEEEEGENPDIAWILVRVSEFPSKGKTILQNNPENNDYFAGYFSWTFVVNGETFVYETKPIRKEKSAFRKPNAATGYRVYSVNNAKLRTRIFIEPQEEGE